MGKEGRATQQQWLPGLEPSPDGGAPERSLARAGKRKEARKGPRPPSIDKLLAQASVKVRKLADGLRRGLLQKPGLVERVDYDESQSSFSPAYAFGQHDVLRLHLDPVLAATVTLDPGDRQLPLLLQSDALPEKLRAQAVKCARKSGRRIFLAFVIRNGEEVSGLLALIGERLKLETA